MQFKTRQMATATVAALRMHWVGWFGQGGIMKDFTTRPWKYLHELLYSACWWGQSSASPPGQKRELITSPWESTMGVPALPRCVSREVVSLQFLYLRVISGCADGNIRVFNFLTGTCLKVLTANTSGGPISSVHVSENRLVTAAVVSELN